MLEKWFTRRRSTPPPSASVAAVASPPSGGGAVAPATAPGSTAWLVVRRPLIDRTGGIAGWDLQLSTRAIERLSRHDSPRVLREAYWFALVQAAREAADASRRVVIGISEHAASEISLLDQLPQRTIVRVGALQAQTLAAQDRGWISRVEARGLLVAAPREVGSPNRCAYVLLDGAQPESLVNPQPGGRLVATNLPTYEAVGEALRNGVDFCSGNFVVAARRQESTQVAPVVVNAANILS
jgi:hypothetical protein